MVELGLIGRGQAEVADRVVELPSGSFGPSDSIWVFVRELEEVVGFLEHRDEDMGPNPEARPQ